jgi:hypothetical protein
LPDVPIYSFLITNYGSTNQSPIMLEGMRQNMQLNSQRNHHNWIRGNGYGDGKWGHLSTRIIVVAAAAIAVGFAVMIGLIAWQSYSAAVDVGYKLASEQASSYAKDAEGDFNQGFTLPHHLADSILGIKRVAAPDRKLADNMIQQLLDGARNRSACGCCGNRMPLMATIMPSAWTGRAMTLLGAISLTSPRMPRARPRWT